MGQSGRKRDGANLSAVLSDVFKWLRGNTFNLAKQVEASIDDFVFRLIHEGKITDARNADGFELKQRPTQLTSQYFRSILPLQFFITVLQIQSKALARRLSACSSSSLQCIGLADWYNAQNIEQLLIVVGPDLHESAVHDVSDSWNGDTSFCDVSGQDDSTGFATVFLLEDSVLIFMWKGGVKHQDL